MSECFATSSLAVDPAPTIPWRSTHPLDLAGRGVAVENASTVCTARTRGKQAVHGIAGPAVQISGRSVRKDVGGEGSDPARRVERGDWQDGYRWLHFFSFNYTDGTGLYATPGQDAAAVFHQDGDS